MELEKSLRIGDYLPQQDADGIWRRYRIIDIAEPIEEGCRAVITLSDHPEDEPA